MQNPTIARVLKYYRKLNHYSVKDVARQLSEGGYSTAEKTIYGWEEGMSMPSADILMYLCGIYGISDILGEFGYRKRRNADTEHTITMKVSCLEENLLHQFRSQPDMQPAVLRLLQIESPDQDLQEDF